MELRQLAYFVAVAEEANFTRAAARVHISQSGVSAQIRQLEQDLGATLFDRSGRTATLTAAGAAALDEARATLRASAAVRAAVDDVNQLLRGRLVVGMVTACTVTPLFDALAAFHARHPGIEVELLEDASEQLVADLRRGVIDLALVGAAGAPPPGLDSLTIISEALVAAVAADHPLAKRRRVTVGELGDHSIISLPVGTGIRAVFDQACAERGVVPDIALQASAPDAVADLAERGLGVAILSQSMAARSAGLHAVRITDIAQPAVLALVWKATPGPALRELLAEGRRAFAAGN